MTAYGGADCKHQWGGKEHEIKKFGDPIFLRLCEWCGSGRVLMGGGSVVISSQEAKTLRTGWRSPL